MSQWRPTAAVPTLRRRAELLAQIRRFFAKRDVVEVTTPVLTATGVSDVHIESMSLSGQRGWLRTSPEYYHKRLLAAGFGDLYEIGPVFRAGESGRHHRPEFTLLEWYRIGWTWRELAAEAVDLVVACLGETGPEWAVDYVTWRQCLGQAIGVDPLRADDRDLARAAGGDAPDDSDRDTLLDFLFATRAQPQLPPRQLTVVYDYPASQAALARLRPDKPCLAERFEIFAGSLELGNGYRELVDAGQQRARFESDNHRRRQIGRRPMPIDEALLAALDSGLPECAGIALGFDRLAMLALAIDEISDVLAFTPPVLPDP